MTIQVRLERPVSVELIRTAKEIRVCKSNLTDDLDIVQLSYRNKKYLLRLTNGLIVPAHESYRWRATGVDYLVGKTRDVLPCYRREFEYCKQIKKIIQSTIKKQSRSRR
jgi:hypothetical protein